MTQWHSTPGLSSIEATLTLNRNPFTAGLAAARAQAKKFAAEKYEATVKINVDKASLNQVTQQLRRFAQNSRSALAKVDVNRVAFDRLVRDLRTFGRQTYVATARVNVANSRSQLGGLINLMNRAGKAADNNARNFDNLERSADGAFRGIGNGARMIALFLPALLPLASTAITGVIGLVGAVGAAFVAAGVGVGAFAAVAIPTFTKIKDAVGKGKDEIAKLPPGLRQAAVALDAFNKTYERLVKQTETPVGFAMQAGFRAATVALKPLNQLVISTSAAFIGIGRVTEQYFNSPHWKNFITLINGSLVPILSNMFYIIALGTRGVMNLVEAFLPLGTWLLDALVRGMQDFANWTEKLGKDKEFQKFLDLVKETLPVVWHLLESVVGFIFKLAVSLTPLGNAIATVLTQVFNGLSKLPPEWLNAIAVGLSAIVTALMLGATGPVGLVIGVIAGVAAALFTLYQNNEDVRQSLSDLWDLIKGKFMPIWDMVWKAFEEKIIPAFKKLVDKINEDIIPSIKEFFKSLDEHLTPDMKEAIRVVVEEFIPALLDFLVAVEPIVNFFIKVFGPVIIYWLQFVTKGFQGFTLGLTGILEVFTGLFTGDWEKFGKGLGDIANGFLTLIAGLFGMNLEEFKQLFRDAGEKIAKNWNEFWSGLFGNVKMWMDFMGRAIQTGIDNIVKGFWEMLDEMKKPIKLVIDVVLNKGILAGWNWVTSHIGLEEWHVPDIPLGWAKGGKVPGYGNKDSVPARLMPGEYVLSKRAVAGMGGPSAVDQLHKAARNGALDALGGSRSDGLSRQALMRVLPWDDIPRGFAYGGVQPHVAAAGDEINSLFGPFAGGIGGVGARANVSDHPRGLALDFMTMKNVGQGTRVVDYLMNNSKRLLVKYLIWQQQINEGNGWKMMEDRGSPTANHMDHVHSSFFAAGLQGIEKFIGGIAGVFATPVRDFLDQFKDKIKAALTFTLPGGKFGEMIGGVPGKIAGAMLDKAEAAVTALENLSGDPGKDFNGGVERWRPLVLQALAMKGLPGALATTVLNRMQRESGGNSAAINLWDSNAAAGHPSKGLMQVIDPTFAKFRDPRASANIYDPLANILASMNYALSRYGSLPAAYDRAGGYRLGGTLNPGQFAYNETGEPEAVLNAQQWNTLYRAATQFGGEGGMEAMVRAIVQEVQPMFGSIHVTTTPQATAQDIISEATFQARAARRMGVYQR